MSILVMRFHATKRSGGGRREKAGERVSERSDRRSSAPATARRAVSGSRTDKDVTGLGETKKQSSVSHWTESARARRGPGGRGRKRKERSMAWGRTGLTLSSETATFFEMLEGIKSRDASERWMGARERAEGRGRGRTATCDERARSRARARPRSPSGRQTSCGGSWREKGEGWEGRWEGGGWEVRTRSTDRARSLPDLSPPTSPADGPRPLLLLPFSGPALTKFNSRRNGI